MLQQVFVSLVGFLRRSESGELAHGIELAAVAGGMNAARIGRLARIAEIGLVIPILGKIGLGIQAPNGNAGNGGEPGMAVVIDVYTARCSNRPLRGLFQSRSQCLLRPLLLRLRRMAAFKHVGYWAFRKLRLGDFLVHESSPL